MNNGYMKTKDFIASMAIFATLLLGVLGYMLSCIAKTEDKIEQTRVEYANIETRLMQIQTDLVWIKREINSN